VKNKTTLYIGVTNDLQRRVLEHENYFIKKSFTGILNFHSTEKKELTINTGFYG
jgi:predicted GIY-YIG superfamily endonuclease